MTSDNEQELVELVREFLALPNLREYNYTAVLGKGRELRIVDLARAFIRLVDRDNPTTKYTYEVEGHPASREVFELCLNKQSQLDQLIREREGLLEWVEKQTKLEINNQMEVGWSRAMFALKSRLTQTQNQTPTEIDMGDRANKS